MFVKAVKTDTIWYEIAVVILNMCYFATGNLLSRIRKETLHKCDFFCLTIFIIKSKARWYFFPICQTYNDVLSLLKSAIESSSPLPNFRWMSLKNEISKILWLLYKKASIFLNIKRCVTFNWLACWRYSNTILSNLTL